MILTIENKGKLFEGDVFIVNYDKLEITKVTPTKVTDCYSYRWEDYEGYFSCKENNNRYREFFTSKEDAKGALKIRVNTHLVHKERELKDLEKEIKELKLKLESI